MRLWHDAGSALQPACEPFTSTGGTAHSTVVTGLQDGGSYTYYVRCAAGATGAANTDDYAISFSIALPDSGTGVLASSSFIGAENPLSENGTWSTTGSWSSMQKNNGAYTTSADAGAILETPAVGPDQYAEISFDQDPGTAGWPGVMTRVQGANNGSGYLAIAYGEQVRLYRTDDNGSLNFTELASADVNLATSPRQLRLESQGSTHRVYFNGVPMITYTDANNTYAAGQRGLPIRSLAALRSASSPSREAILPAVVAGAAAATMISPAQAAHLTSASTTFTWSAGSAE